jgi:hypothetical protein
MIPNQITPPFGATKPPLHDWVFPNLFVFQQRQQVIPELLVQSPVTSSVQCCSHPDDKYHQHFQEDEKRSGINVPFLPSLDINPSGGEPTDLWVGDEGRLTLDRTFEPNVLKHALDLLLTAMASSCTATDMDEASGNDDDCWDFHFDEQQQKQGSHCGGGGAQQKRNWLIEFEGDTAFGNNKRVRRH